MAENKDAMQDEITRLKAQLAESKKKEEAQSIKHEMDKNFLEIDGYTGSETGGLEYIPMLIAGIYHRKAKKAAERGDIELAKKYMKMAKAVVGSFKVICGIIGVCVLLLLACIVCKALS